MHSALSFIFLLIAAASALNLLDTAQSAGLTSLVTAVREQNLGTALNATGPLTVFAPTNVAFTAAGSIPSVSNTLLYHVIAGNYSSADIVQTETKLTTSLNGWPVFVRRVGNNFFVNGINIAQADVVADNGIAHVIGTVLTPPTGTVVQTAVSGGFGTLVSLVTAANLVTALNDTSATTVYTVFAPTNTAFAAVPACILTYLNNNLTQLTNVLRYHVISGTAYFSATIPSGTTFIPTLASANVNVTKSGATVTVGSSSATVVNADITTINGVVHAIDRVLLPPNFPAQASIPECASTPVPEPEPSPESSANQLSQVFSFVMLALLALF